MRISDWSSDVCSSDLVVHRPCDLADAFEAFEIALVGHAEQSLVEKALHRRQHDLAVSVVLDLLIGGVADPHRSHAAITGEMFGDTLRSEEHTSELQSLMRISYAVFCLKHKTQNQINTNTQ